jgi:ABC-type multidrug transport system fused ATPase/permease subunit
VRELFVIVARARRSFQGGMLWRLGVAIAMAVLGGAIAGTLPAVIGRAVGTVAGSVTPGASPAGGLGRLVALAMPDDNAWAVVAVTFAATVITVAVGVAASRLGSGLAGDLTAALRIELMRSVLHASPRAVAEAGAALVAPRGKGPPGSAAPPGVTAPAGGAPPPGKAAPPGAAPPSATSAAPGAPGGAPRAASSGALDEAVVRLAVSREAATVSDFSISVLTSLPQSLATLLVLGIELVSSGAWLVLVGGAGLFVTSRLLADRATKRVAAARHELNNADAAVFAALGETLAASEDLRLWGARKQAVSEFAQVAHDCARARARFASALAVAGQIRSVFTAMAPLLLVVALELAGGAYDAGEIATLLLLVPLLMVRLEALDAMRQGMHEREPVLGATRRLLELPSAPVRAPAPRHLDAAEVRGSIVFDGVTFSPPGVKRALLSDVSVDIPAGAVVGVCGKSGSGKSTLVRLLLRLDDPLSGRIALDGVDLRDIEPDELPRLFAVVRQTSQLLQRPVRDNLSLGLEPAPADEALKRALRAVELDELCNGGARGLDTAYRAQPPNFSGGECRRMLVARMLLSGARVCVLDEPEAGLPGATAQDILRTVVEQANGRTVIVVTHAPALLRSTFNLVLDDGRLVAQGSHDELVASSQVYRDLLAEHAESPVAAGARPPPSLAW